MPKKFTREQAEKMRYRQILLDEKLREISNMINGRGQSFYPFIADENGKVSDKKLDAFISELMKSLKHYRSASEEGKFDKTAEEAYRCFLYYACLGLIWTADKRSSSAVQTVISETFADIIDFAEGLAQVNYSSYDEFLTAAYKDLREGTSELPQFFVRIWESLQLLGYAEPFAYMQSREVLLKLCKKYAEENNISDKENSRYVDEINALFEDTYYPEPEPDFEEDEDSINAMIEEYIAEEEKKQEIADAIDALGEDDDYSDSELLKEYSSEEIEGIENWNAEQKMLDTSAYWRSNTVADHKRFFDSCSSFIRLYFSIDRRKMLDDITHMIDAFLFEHKLSAFSFGRAYGLVTYQVEKMQDRIETKIERAKTICG